MSVTTADLGNPFQVSCTDDGPAAAHIDYASRQRRPDR
jgi:hypothetical protein